ncbi:DUF5011 domain-containing protein [Listeria booriae]|uniref:DUF5011 domain-containing protein n=1 Tax=Listeria booriae TaxID=1552123 RepID=A0A842CTX2_9LIST|nr:immunoglobulin-like domain-containing protein [Listeria booriae]MBC2002172.1 DUF5011 domain-containing protein [Listeria booriae]
MKNKLMKKVAVGALTTAVVASQLATTIPYNVFAAETTPKTQATQATAAQYYPVSAKTQGNQISILRPTSTTITGIAHPNETVEVMSMYNVAASSVPNFDHTTVADSTGAFSLDIPTVPENDLIMMKFSNDPGNAVTLRSTSNPDGTVPLKDVTINKLTTESTVVSGITYPYGGVYISNNDGTIKDWAYADADGNYSKVIPKQAAGTTISAIQAYNAGGINEIKGSEEASTIVTAPDATKPVITASNKTLTVGDSFDPKAGVTASDDTDGNITSKITVADSNVDTSKAGTYYVTYSVSDAAGNVATKTITVTVNEAPDTIKPVITASNKTLTVGDSFDPKAGVTASDNKDGNITSKIAVTSNNVDTTKAGTYSVTYSVTDAAGNVGTKTITVTVNEAPDTTKPVITASNKTLTVGDSFDPKAGVSASDDTDGNITSKVVVTSNNVDTSKAGAYTVSYSVTDAAGNMATKTITVTVIDVATSGTITANDFTIGKDGYIKGAITGDVASIKMIINGKVYSSRNVQSPSNYQYYVAGQITSTNDAVTIVAYDKNGKELDRANVNVKNNQAEVGTITAKTFTVGKDGYVQGAYTGKAAKVGLLVNGKELNNIAISGGSYRYYAGRYITSANDDVYAVLYDASGLEMARVKVTVQKAADNTSGTVTAKDFAIGDGDSYVRGTISGDVAKVSTIINGKEGSRISVSGVNYQYYVGSKISSLNDNVTVVAYDAQGKELDRTTVNVKKSEVPTAGTVTANDFTIGGGDNYVHGTFTGDVAKVSTIINGQEGSRISVSGGNYQYYVGGKISSVNDAVTVVAYDAKGKELDRTTVNVKKAEVPTAGTITAKDYLVGGYDKYIYGTTTGDAVVVKMMVNGTLVPAQRAVEADGSYKYYAGDNITSVNDVVTMITYDAKGKELDRTDVKLTQTAGTVTINPYTLGDSYLTGTATGDVTKVQLLVDGVAKSTAFVKDGAFSYYAKSTITSKTGNYVLVGLDGTGRELTRQTVTVQ